MSDMFKILDTNKDDIFTSEDVENFTKDNLKKFLGRMQDRFADLTDILIDQKIDFHIAKEYPKSRKSIVREITEKSVVKDEL